MHKYDAVAELKALLDKLLTMQNMSDIQTGPVNKRIMQLCDILDSYDEKGGGY